jgi:hypothetical protein
MCDEGRTWAGIKRDTSGTMGSTLAMAWLAGGGWGGHGAWLDILTMSSILISSETSIRFRASSALIFFYTLSEIRQIQIDHIVCLFVGQDLRLSLLISS